MPASAHSGPPRRPSLRSIDQRNALVLANTGLVAATLRRYFPALPAPARDDAFQAGLIGLLRAAELFDPARGFQFSTYAVRWIRQAIGQHGDESDLIRVPSRIRGEERQEARARLHARRFKQDHESLLPGRVEEQDRGENAALAASVLSKLHPVDRRVLRERFFQGRTLDEVGAALGVSKERVRQIQKRALARARLLLGADWPG